MNVFPLVWSFFAAGIVGVMWLLAASQDRHRVGYWCALGIALAVLKMVGIQMLPQWQDTPIDSITFQIHAEALLLNWRGLPVNASEYRLQFGPIWVPDARLPYVGVLGTYEWLYSAFLAGWKFIGEEWLAWSAMGNAAMAGAFPAASFILVRLLGGSVGVAHLGAMLVALESSAAVNSAWLIKDTLAGFLALLVAITLCRLYKRPSWACTFALALVMGMLAGIRFVAYVAYVGAVLGLCLWLLRHKAWHKFAAFSLATALSLGVFVLIHAAPSLPSFDQWTNALKGPAQAQVHTLKAGEGEKGADESVIKWREDLRERPGWAITRSIIRTLMAPYPWVALTNGLSGDNHIELYLLGTVLWILCLPAIFAGMLVALARERVMTAMLLFYLALVAVAYITFFGEWSTRQRVFMIPLFFAFAAIGWERFWNLVRCRCRSATQTDTSTAERTYPQ